jgi:lipooligosaccharide transport system ATP-binding protein
MAVCDNSIICIKGLVKRFGTRQAVNRLNISLGHGECLGLLGPNGAGKSTTIKMMLGLAKPDAGSISIFGIDVLEDGRDARRRTGVVPQNDNLDPDLTVLENLLTYASYFGTGRSGAMPRIMELLKFIALENRKDEIIQNLSGGQRRRLLLARAMVNRPDLLILDEPTVGLDPQARRLIWERLNHLREKGVTMLITSHYIEEIENLANRVIIIDNGTVIAEGSPQELIAEHVGRTVIRISGNREDMETFSKKAEKCGVETERDNSSLYLYVGDECGELEKSVMSYRHVIKRPATLEDVFLKLTGRTLRES